MIKESTESIKELKKALKLANTVTFHIAQQNSIMTCSIPAKVKLTRIL